MPSKPVRPNQFGITLSEGAANVLRAKAARLRTPPATLAAQLVEEALAQKLGGGARDDRALLQAILRELSVLGHDQYASTVKILSKAGGMPGDEIERWASRRLKR